MGLFGDIAWDMKMSLGLKASGIKRRSHGSEPVVRGAAGTRDRLPLSRALSRLRPVSHSPQEGATPTRPFDDLMPQSDIVAWCGTASHWSITNLPPLYAYVISIQQNPTDPRS